MRIKLPKVIIEKLVVNKVIVKTKKEKVKPYFKFTAFYRVKNQIITTEVTMIVLLDTQKVSLAVSPVSVKGNAAVLDGAPVWSVSDESILSVVPSEDGLSATVTAVGPVGLAQVIVKGDADLGEGIVEITGTLDVEITASAAATFAIVPGTPELA